VSAPGAEPPSGGGLPGATGEQAAQASGELAAPERPEVAVGLAFAGGLLAAILLKRLGS
jgi:hypothetical protein